MTTRSAIPEVNEAIIRCHACERLVAWREQVARDKVKRFVHEAYWGKPVPGFGDPDARLLIVGLAPAAHGANRTGRMFTGDRSGDWLYRSLHKFGFASQAESSDRGDGLTLCDCYITAAVHCAPPQNKPTAQERRNCMAFLQREVQALSQVRVVVALGRIAFDTLIRLYVQLGQNKTGGRPVFAHAARFRLKQDLTLIASYHPSQQNTFTGRLTEPMFDTVFQHARKLLHD